MDNFDFISVILMRLLLWNFDRDRWIIFIGLGSDLVQRWNIERLLEYFLLTLCYWYDAQYKNFKQYLISKYCYPMTFYYIVATKSVISNKNQMQEVIS